MKAVLGTRRLLALCSLPIALWSAAPSIRWCAISWSDFPECLVRAPGGRCDVAAPRAAGTAGADCESEVWAWGLLCEGTACPPGGALTPKAGDGPACASECGAAACDPLARDGDARTAEATAPADSRDPARGFCIRGPAGGVGVKTELLRDASPQPVHSLPVTALEAATESSRPARVQAGESPRPPATRWAIRPPVRAPPLV